MKKKLGLFGYFFGCWWWLIFAVSCLSASGAQSVWAWWSISCYAMLCHGYSAHWGGIPVEKKRIFFFSETATKTNQVGGAANTSERERVCVCGWNILEQRGKTLVLIWLFFFFFVIYSITCLHHSVYTRDISNLSMAIPPSVGQAHLPSALSRYESSSHQHCQSQRGVGPIGWLSFTSELATIQNKPTTTASYSQ